MAEPDDPDFLPTQSWAGPGESSAQPESPLPAPAPKSGSRRGGWQPPTPEELQPSFPQYEIAGVLGRGGMGAVYKGWQKRLGRFVAIKILRPDIEDDAGNFAKRFEREAKAMARLSHPGIVSVFDAGETAGLIYFIMEYVEGSDVEKLVAAQGRLSPELAWTIASRVCEALAYAHENGVIHRDIKPSNVMVDATGRVKVADFGLAKIAADATALLTVSHVRMGTPDFMAPEAMMGGEVDQRADLYAVGVMLYRMLTGDLPRGRFELPSRRISGLDIRFDQIIDHALQADPRKRYSSATDILADLGRIVIDPLRQASSETEAPDAETALDVKPPSDVKSGPDVKAGPDVKPPPDSKLPLNLKLALASWAPSLRDLLRIRHKLTPAEAWSLGDKLATMLDEEPPDRASNRTLQVHGISISFHGLLVENDARAKLREEVTGWPPFDLSIDAGKNPAEGETVLLKGMETIVTAGNPAGDRVQQLGRVLYELLGGVAGSEYVPLASAGGKGNAVLRRGITEGMKAFPKARDFIVELRGATAHQRAQQPAPRQKIVVYPPENGKTSSAPGRKVFNSGVLWAMALMALGVFGWIKFTPHGKSSVKISASLEAPFVNSLGMKFVPLIARPMSGPPVLFSVWDTRVQDYAIYAREKGLKLESPPFEQGPTHPVVMVDWDHAKSFCDWLTDKDRVAGLIGRHDQYRLPSEMEWSCAVGINTVERFDGMSQLRIEIVDLYPWGKQWPPPIRAGDYAGEEIQTMKGTSLPAKSYRDWILGYDDGFIYTAPVGSFAVNRHGLYDMGGNVWQWCEDLVNEDEQKRTRVLRGGSWRNFEQPLLRSTYRNLAQPGERRDDYGFRCVLVVAGG